METGRVAAADQRKQVRKEIIGEILWAYASGECGDTFKGVITEESESGLSILSLVPIPAGTALKIFLRGREGSRSATVIWCREVLPDIYRSGLLISESPDCDHPVSFF